jgi:ATP-dependent protease ClpP protease subunit
MIKISNSASGTTVVDIEGTIGVPEQWQFDEPAGRIATYEKFQKTVAAISRIGGGEVTVNIRSTGGDVGDALLIHDALRGLRNCLVTTRCHGYVASAATVIAQAASEGRREISSTSLYLVHNSVAACEGNAGDLRRDVELLAKTDRRIAELYAARSGRPADGFADLMAENNGSGRWLSPEETLAAGLADRIVEAAVSDSSDGGASKSRRDRRDGTDRDGRLGRTGGTDGADRTGGGASKSRTDSTGGSDRKETAASVFGITTRWGRKKAATAATAAAADRASEVSTTSAGHAATIGAAVATGTASRNSSAGAALRAVAGNTATTRNAGHAARNATTAGASTRASEADVLRSDRNVELERLRHRLRSLESETAQSGARPTRTAQKEDPAIAESRRTANEDAYHRDAENILLPRD